MIQKGALILFYFQLKFHSSVLSFQSETFRDNVLSKTYKLNTLVNELDYSPYLQEVLELIRSHDDVHKNLIADYKNEGLQKGKIGNHLELLSKHQRNALDELKRLELQRIRKYGEELQRQGHTESSIRRIVKDISIHVDTQNLRKFGTEDLRKLIHQATNDIEQLDSMRKRRFKEYEIHKRLELEELKKRLSPEALAEVEKNIEELYRKHLRRKPIHIPLSKPHLLKVWTEKDFMHKSKFNIKTFFHLHDLDGNSFLDENELKVLMEGELMKQYNHTDIDFDSTEKAEERERMAEYALKKVDTNTDHLISLTEFIDHVESKGVDDYEFWEVLVLAQNELFTEEEYEQYALENRDEVNKMIDEGLITLPETGVVSHKL